MTGTDMIIWQASSTSSTSTDLQASGRGRPATDTSQDYSTTFNFNGTHVEFISDRKLNTGDPTDFIINMVNTDSLTYSNRTLR